MFLQVLAYLISGEQRNPRPLPIERRPELVVDGCGPRQLHFVFSEKCEMAAGDICERFILRPCHRCLPFVSSSPIIRPFRDLGSTVETESSVIRQLRAAVHAKHLLHPQVNQMVIGLSTRYRFCFHRGFSCNVNHCR